MILGNQATLTCNLESGNTGNPDAMFTWTRTNDGDWSMETGDGRVTFTVDKLDMEDTYQCLPWNIHGQGQAATVSLTAQGIFRLGLPRFCLTSFLLKNQNLFIEKRSGSLNKCQLVLN